MRTACAIICLSVAWFASSRAQEILREVDPTQAPAIADASRAGVWVRTTSVTVLPDLRGVDLASWCTVRGVRTGAGYARRGAPAVHDIAWRASLDGTIADAWRGGITARWTRVSADDARSVSGAPACAAIMAWTPSPRGARRWVRVGSRAIGAHDAWRASAGWDTAPLSEERGARIGCSFSMGASDDGGVVGASMRASLVCALELSRSVTLDLGAGSEPPSAALRLTWQTGALRGDVERRSIFGFGDVRAWGMAWIAQP